MSRLERLSNIALLTTCVLVGGGSPVSPFFKEAHNDASRAVVACATGIATTQGADRRRPPRPVPVDTSIVRVSSHHLPYPTSDLLTYPVRVIFLKVVCPCSEPYEAAVMQLGGESFGRSR